MKFSEIGDAEIGCVFVDDEPYFNSIDLCNVLGFETKNKRAQAIRTHVHDDDKTNFETLASHVQVYENPNLDCSVGKVICMNESGLYSLAFGSKKPFARLSKRWVTSEVLPQIRKTGSYNNAYQYKRNKPELGLTERERWEEVARLAEGREDDLHYKVVDRIRGRYPDAIAHAGLG